MTARTFRLLSIDRSDTHATQNILLEGNEFQMIGIRTSPISAQVVGNQAIGYWAIEQLVEDAMDAIN
jgi:hypothetical protein